MNLCIVSYGFNLKCSLNFTCKKPSSNEEGASIVCLSFELVLWWSLLDEIDLWQDSILTGCSNHKPPSTGLGVDHSPRKWRYHLGKVGMLGRNIVKTRPDSLQSTCAVKLCLRQTAKMLTDGPSNYSWKQPTDWITFGMVGRDGWRNQKTNTKYSMFHLVCNIWWRRNSKSNKDNQILKKVSER